MIKVFVADDHVHAVEGLSLIIDRAEDMEVVGSAGIINQVLEQATAAEPDVIVLDLAWPGDKLAGIRLIPELLASCPGGRVLAITNYPELIEVAREKGAYPLSKGFSIEELLGTIRWVARDNLAASLATAVGDAYTEPLTPREIEVLKVLGDGKTDREIAQELHIAEGTAKKHVSNILSKLGVGNRTEAVIKARHLRLL